MQNSNRMVNSKAHDQVVMGFSFIFTFYIVYGIDAKVQLCVCVS
jgi:hypothetical protein